MNINDLHKSEKLIIEYVQSCEFPNVKKTLEKKCEIKSSCKIRDLNPLIHDEIIRVGGRLKYSHLSFNEKHPIILPSKHPVTKMIITQTHEEVGHAGRQHVLAKTRESYWIIKGLSAVKSTLRECIKCRKIQASPPTQIMSDLPEERTAVNQPPFYNTGVDLFGPFYVKVHRSQEKRYGVIFTCLTTRAVHLEVAHSLDASSFINALTRFTARRGPITYLRSDRGTNLTAADQELKNALLSLEKDNFSNLLLSKGIQWAFNTPHASHHGGVWERLIRSVRKIIDGILKEQTLKEESLPTLFCEVENIMNSRPLTTVSSDTSDLNPLTPNHLLRFNGNVQTFGTFTDIEKYSRKRWKQIQYLADVFWSQWKKEYLSALQKRNCWKSKRENISVGDVVLLKDEMTPRCQWPLGRVIEVIKSKDHLIRSVKIKTQNSEYTRPISKIILLFKKK